MDKRTSNILVALGFSILTHAAILVGGGFFWRNNPLSIEQASISVEFFSSDSVQRSRETSKINPKRPTELTSESIPAKAEDPLPARAALPEAAPPVQAPIYTPGHLTHAPRFRHRVDVIYPVSERATGAEAQVLAEAVIDTSGSVVEINIIESAGSNFDAAVMKALRKSTFVPGYLDSNPVVTRVQIPFLFKLR